MPKLDAVVVCLEQHNENAATKLDVAKIKAALEALGASSDEALAQCRYEDLEDVGIPRLLARHIANDIIRGTTPTGQLKQTEVAVKPALMTIDQLLDAYVPDDSGSKITKRLQEISKGFKCIVFTDEGLVNVVESSKLLAAIKVGHGERAEVMVDGELRRVYKIGELPDRFVDENPLYPGRPLFPGEICDQTNRSWAGVSSEIRQLVWVLSKYNPDKSFSRDTFQINQIFEYAVANDLMKLRMLFPKAAQHLKDLKDAGNMPSLKVLLRPALPQVTAPGAFEVARTVEVRDIGRQPHTGPRRRSTAAPKWVPQEANVVHKVFHENAYVARHAMPIWQMNDNITLNNSDGGRDGSWCYSTQ